MVGRRAELSAPVLRAFRRRWAHAQAHAVDGISVFPPRSLLHVDLRSRQAKQREHHAFGGLATCLSGDFLQLPPVEEPSLALPLDDEGYARELDDATPDRRTDGDAAHRERREFEHRGGFEL